MQALHCQTLGLGDLLWQDGAFGAVLEGEEGSLLAEGMYQASALNTVHLVIFVPVHSCFSILSDTPSAIPHPSSPTEICVHASPYPAVHSICAHRRLLCISLCIASRLGIIIHCIHSLCHAMQWTAWRLLVV